MVLPSLDSGWQGGKRTKPRIYVLGVHDRDSPDPETGTPIAWLLVERQETYRHDERDGSVCDASIRISYERVQLRTFLDRSGKGYFAGGFSRSYADAPIVSLTSESMSKGAVFLDLPGLEGQRIGTYFMNEIVTWVRQWPEATVLPIELLDGQAQVHNRARRNRFYEQFGLVFEYRDPEHREGLSRRMPAGDLRPALTWQRNIHESHVADFLAELIANEEQARWALAQRDRLIEDLRGDIERAEASPIRWALRQLWGRVAPVFGTAAVVLLFATLLWSVLTSKR